MRPRIEVRGRHRWGPPSRVSRFKTERACTRCKMVRVTRKEGAPNWTEFWRPGPPGEVGERIETPGERTPACDPRIKSGGEGAKQEEMADG